MHRQWRPTGSTIPVVIGFSPLGSFAKVKYADSTDEKILTVQIILASSLQSEKLFMQRILKLQLIAVGIVIF